MGKVQAKPAGNPDIPQLIGRARAKLELEGVLKTSALGPKEARAAVLLELGKLGFEITDKVVRKPLGAQLEAALLEGAFIPLKRAAAHALGSNATEAKRAALALVANGSARLVLRGAEEVLVPAGAEILSREELSRFEVVAKLVAKAARAKSGASLLRSDLADAISEAVPLRARAHRAPPSVAPANTLPDPAVQRLLAAVDATRDVQTGLSFVPAIIARLRPDWDSETAQIELLSAANHGLLELRPEGGINRLSAHELSLCPPGPQGTRLSWARRTEDLT